MNKRQFSINLISNLLSAFTGVGLSFFLTPFIVSTLGKEVYGFFPLSNNFLLYAGVITTALNSMSGRFITISLEKKNISEVNVYFNSVLFGNLLISLFFLTIAVLLFFFVGSILDIPIDYLTDIRLLFFTMFLSMVISISSSVFSVTAFALNRLDKVALIAIVSNVLRLLVIIALFYIFKPRLYFLGLSAIVVAIYVAVANYKVSKSLLPEIVIDIRMFSWSALMVLVGAGIWNSVLALSNVVNTQLDLLIANRFFGAEEMGTLALTKIVPVAMQVLTGVIVPIFLPEMLKAYANDNIFELKRILLFSFKAVFVIVLVPMSIFIVYGEEFFQLWLPGQDFQILYYISIITLIPFVLHATIETVYHVFVITNKLRIASIWGVFVSCSNLVIVVLLATYTELGLFAIPVAALITGFVNHMVFLPIYAAYCLNEKPMFFYVKIFQGLIMYSGLVLIGFIWKKLNFLSVTGWYSFFANVVIVFFVAMFITLYFRFDKRTLLLTINKVREKISI